MTATTPCQESPDDWFIEKNGRQYVDDDLLSADLLDLLHEMHEDDGEKLIAELARSVAAAKKAQLTRRRRALEGCYSCPVRMACLDIAIFSEDPPEDGIWGGYYPEQLSKIRAEKRKRDQRTMA